MSAWPAKDPDAVLDYTYTIALDEGDAVDTSTFSRVSGTVEIDSQSRDEAEWTVRLSGGEDGETSAFKVAWTTTAGREDEDYVTILIAANDYVALDPTGYTKPLPQHLKARYPAFADVAIATVQYWLTDAERYVDSSWTEGDYAAGLMALAAHNMMIAGLGTEAAALAAVPLGVTNIKSGTLSASFSSESAAGRISGALGSTRYGVEYQGLLRRNRGGALVLPTGTLPYDPRRFPQGEE
jgi:hypothetical protein